MYCREARIFFDGVCYQARQKSESDNLFDSPILYLIEGLYLRYSENARRMLRAPIEINYEPGDFEKNLIKLAAKRYRRVTSCEQVDDENTVTVIADQEAIGPFVVPEEALNFSSQKSVFEWFDLYRKNKGVICALFSKEHHGLAFSKNTNSIIKNRHAELNLLRFIKKNWSSEQMQNVAYMVVSLQSCRMCAAALHSLMPQLPVFYFEAEKGLKNVKTLIAGREFYVGADGSDRRNNDQEGSEGLSRT